jgi:hypothetical protein
MVAPLYRYAGTDRDGRPGVYDPKSGVFTPNVTYDSQGHAYIKKDCSRAQCEINPCNGSCKERVPRFDKALPWSLPLASKEGAEAEVEQPPKAAWPFPDGRDHPGMDNHVIRSIFLDNGFSINPGETDLKDYVFKAAWALLRRQELLNAGERDDAVLQLRREIAELRSRVPATLEPVEGDLLPPVGEKVLIHLASLDGWVEHEVVGYYVWGDHNGSNSLHRVIIRVKDKDGILNARSLSDVIRFKNAST